VRESLKREKYVRNKDDFEKSDEKLRREKCLLF